MERMNPCDEFAIAPGLPPVAIEELCLMMRAAHRAGDLIRSGYNQIQIIEEKGHGDLVSKIDRDCDDVVDDEISKSHPGEVILSEEKNPDADISKGKAWVVDPLDATSALLFRASEDMPSVMIARTEDGQANSSIVYFPLTDEMFYAVKGFGAYKDKQRLQCSGAKLAESWVEMNQQGNSGKESPVFNRLRVNLRLPGGARLVSSSPPHSGVGIRIAEGRKKLAAVVHDNNAGEAKKAKQAPWDVIPVALILKEAGGVVVNFDGEAYDPFKPEPLVMAASKELADEIRARAKAHLDLAA
jgi:myo-inositol-1(or 4)-monophosphatase